MSIFNRFRKQKDVKESALHIRTQEQEISIEAAVRRHENIVLNLKDELLTLQNSLEVIELSIEMPKAKREKDSDNIIRRMSIIKYEIEIREDLIKWLS